MFRFFPKHLKFLRFQKLRGFPNFENPPLIQPLKDKLIYRDARNTLQLFQLNKDFGFSKRRNFSKFEKIPNGLALNIPKR